MLFQPLQLAGILYSWGAGEATMESTLIHPQWKCELSQIFFWNHVENMFQELQICAYCINSRNQSWRNNVKVTDDSFMHRDVRIAIKLKSNDFQE